MNNIKNEKGITLISVVVTIVVLAIISSIVISTSISDNGLINTTTEQTKKAKINKYMEMIETIRQEAMSREYLLIINEKEMILEEMLRIIEESISTTNSGDTTGFKRVIEDENNFNSKIWKDTNNNNKSFIEVETHEGYIFKIYEDETVEDSN